MYIKSFLFAIAAILSAESAYARCTTQTIIMGDKVIVCTTCGSITNCV